MANLGIFKTFDAEGEIAPYRICAHGSKDYAVKQATAKTDALLGTTDELGRQPNNRVDVCLDKMPEVEAGGTLAAGDPLTSDAKGNHRRRPPYRFRSDQRVRRRHHHLYPCPRDPRRSRQPRRINKEEPCPVKPLLFRSPRN